MLKVAVHREKSSKSEHRDMWYPFIPSCVPSRRYSGWKAALVPSKSHTVGPLGQRDTGGSLHSVSEPAQAEPGIAVRAEAV